MFTEKAHDGRLNVNPLDHNFRFGHSPRQHPTIKSVQTRRDDEGPQARASHSDVGEEIGSCWPHPDTPTIGTTAILEGAARAPSAWAKGNGAAGPLHMTGRERIKLSRAADDGWGTPVPWEGSAA